MSLETNATALAGGVGARVAGAVGWITRRKRRSAVTLIASVLVGIAALAYGASIRVDTDLRRLLPSSAPSVQALDLIEDRKGSAESFVVAIEAPTAEDADRMARAIAQEVASWPETRSSTVERDYTPLRDHGLYLLELDALIDLRDELVGERKRAVARAMGPGLVDGEIDPNAVSVDDWDDPAYDNLDWGTPDDDGQPDAPAPVPAPSPDPVSPAPAPSPDSAPSPAPSPDADPASADASVTAKLDERLTKLRADLVAQGTLDADEVDLIWPTPNEQGEVEWHEHVGRPFSADEGRIRTLHASLSTPATDVEFAQDVVGRVERRAAALRGSEVDAATRVQVVAAYNVSGPVNTIVRDARRATWISGTLVLAVLLLGFRNLRVVPLITIPMTVAMSMTLAVAKWGYGELNALTVFLFAVLFGMGVDFSVHLFALREQQGRDADWVAVIREHFRPLAAAMATTAASLAVLGLAEFKAFREFGMISAIGVVLCFLAALVLVPATDTLLGPLRRSRAQAPSPTAADSLAAGRPKLTLSPTFARRLTLARYATLVMLAGVALWGAPKIAMEKDTRVLNASDAADADPKGEIAYRSTGGRYKSCALVADSAEELDLVVARFQAEEGLLLPDAIDTGEPRNPWVTEVYSVQTVMPTNQSQKAPVIAELATLTNDLLAELPDLDADARRYQTQLEALEHMAKAKPLTVDELPDWTLEPFREQDGRSDRIAHAYLDIAVYNIDELVAVRHRLDHLLAGTEVRAADSRLVFADLMVLVEDDAKRVPAYAFLMILLFIAIDLRKPLPILACFLTLALGVALAVAFMGLWPLRLNFFNLVVMPAVVGLGIDASIHLWHAREKSSLAATGKASLLAALTTVAGFSGLLAANHAGLRSIGEVGVMAIVICVGVAFLALYPIRSAPR